MMNDDPPTGQGASDFAEGLSSLGSTESPEQVAARYDEWTDQYESDVRSWGYDVPERLAVMLDLATGRVLDAGCGTGLCGVAIAEHSPDLELAGVDASPESVAKAASLEVYTATSVVDLSAPLPLADAEFDAVVSGGVFTYIDDTESALRELVRVTKPGGRVIFTQRTDKWAERDCDAVIESLQRSGCCTAVVGEPQAYLPGLDDYGDAILVIYTVLTVLAAA